MFINFENERGGDREGELLDQLGYNGFTELVIPALVEGVLDGSVAHVGGVRRSNEIFENRGDLKSNGGPERAVWIRY